MRHSRVSLSMLVIGLMLLTSCRSGSRDISEGEDGELLIGQAEVSETTSRGVNPGNRTLVISGFNGVIELTGSDQPNAQLEFTKRARGRDDAAARNALDGISVDEVGAEETYRFDLTSDNADRSAVDVRGTIPVGTPVRIDMTHGRISVSAADGPVEVDVRNGSVRVGGTSRDVTVNVANGDIDVATRMIPPDGRLNLETSNGTVTLRMPASSSTRVDARTSVGTINVEGLDFSSRRLQRQGAGATFSGQLGGGNARVELRVQNGLIRLLEGQTLSLDGLGTPDISVTPDMLDADTTVSLPDGDDVQVDTTSGVAEPVDTLNTPTF